MLFPVCDLATCMPCLSPAVCCSVMALVLKQEDREKGEGDFTVLHAWVCLGFESTAWSMFQSIKYPNQNSPGSEVNSVQKPTVFPSRGRDFLAFTSTQGMYRSQARCVMGPAPAADVLRGTQGSSKQPAAVRSATNSWAWVPIMDVACPVVPAS